MNNTITGGFYSFIHDMERLNLLVDTYNSSLGVEAKLTVKKGCNSGSPNMTNIRMELDFWIK
jgi:hypothetical protein